MFPFSLPIHVLPSCSQSILDSGFWILLESWCEACCEGDGLTHRHESHDQLGVGDVGTSHTGPADHLADVRVHAAHLICRSDGS